jgi:hypothetical protein
VGWGGSWGGGDGGGNLTNVQYKAIWNCHNEYALYNGYILIKLEKNPKNKTSKKKYLPCTCSFQKYHGIVREE